MFLLLTSVVSFVRSRYFCDTLLATRCIWNSFQLSPVRTHKLMLCGVAVVDWLTGSINSKEILSLVSQSV